MAGVEENDIDRLLANPPEKVEIEVKYKNCCDGYGTAILAKKIVNHRYNRDL